MKNRIDVQDKGGMSFLSVILIIFIILKITNLISWSWWWVLSPLWIGFALASVVVIYLTIWYKIDQRKSR